MKNSKIKALTCVALLGTFCLASATPFASYAQEAQQAHYTLNEAKADGAASVYDYYPNAMYDVNVTTKRITDIALQPGEQVTYVAAGDTVNWLLDMSTVGSTPHIYVKPLKENIVTNLIINTNKYSYRFVLHSGNTYTKIVSFNYPEEVRQAMMKEQARPVFESKEEKLFIDTHTDTDKNGLMVAKKTNSQYKFKNKKVDKTLVPTEMYDDGKKTYIKIPATNQYNFPTLYLMDDGQMTLVNYRVQGNYLVADRVFQHGRLKYSANAYIDFFNVSSQTK